MDSLKNYFKNTVKEKFKNQFCLVNNVITDTKTEDFYLQPTKEDI